MTAGIRHHVPTNQNEQKVRHFFVPFPCLEDDNPFLMSFLVSKEYLTRVQDSSLRTSIQVAMASTPSHQAKRRPAFSELPLCAGDPPFSAWGLYGLDDELGSLNLLTEETVVDASREIVRGKRIGLNLPLTVPSPATHNRMGFKHQILRKHPRNVHDDIIEMNTQCSTQWDGFRHYGYQQEGLYYNGVTNNEISGAESGVRLGLGLWCKQGIAGRGVLLDYLKFAETNKIEHESLNNHAITLDQVRACVKAQQLELHKGDVLIIRTGFTKAYKLLNQAGREQWASQTPPRLGGVETSKEIAEWIWDTGFSAVASDGVAFESLPFKPEGEPGGLERYSLHEILLSGWGMPIGECQSIQTTLTSK